MADETTTMKRAEGASEAGVPEATSLDSMVIDDFAAFVYLSTPAAGQTEEVLLAVGDIVRVDFDINNQTLVVDGNDLRIEFESGAVLILDNFAALADQGVAPLFSLPDGAMIPGDILLSALAETPLETAAGETAASGGAGEYRADMGDLLDGIDRLGGQDPDPFGAEALQALEDEQTPLLIPDITVNGAIEGSNIDVPEGTDAVFTVQITNAAPGSTITLSLADGTAVDADYNEAYFEYSFNGTDWFAVSGPISIEAGNSTLLVRTDTVDDSFDEANETFDLTATLTSQGAPYQATGTATIIDDDTTPEVGVSSATVSEEGLSEGISDDVGVPSDDSESDIFIDTLSVFDADGDTLTVTFEDAPADGAFTSGGDDIIWTGQGTNTLVGSAAGKPVITISIGNDGQYTVDLDGPVDHASAGIEDILSFNLTVRASDGYQSSTGSLTVNIEDDSPVVTGTENTEVAYDIGSSFTGDLGIAYGADGPYEGSLELTGISVNDPVMATSTSGTAQMTADDVPLVYNFDSNGDLIAVKANDPGYVAFRLSLNEDSGEYTFTVVNGVDGGPTSTLIDLTDASNIHGGNVGELLIDVYLDDDNVADAVLVATGTGASADDTVNYNANAMGVGVGCKVDPGDTLTLSYHEGDYTNVGATKLIAQADVSAWHLDANETGVWTVYLDGIEVGTGTFTGTGAKFDYFTVKPTLVDPDSGEVYTAFDTIAFTSTTDSEYGINQITIYDREIFDGADQTLTFNFGLTDADLDPASGSFTVTFDADLSTPQLINEPPAMNLDTGNDTVYEAGLSGGSSIGPVTVTADGTFTISDPDGLDDIYSISIAGSNPYLFGGGVQLKDLVGNTFETDHGEVKITGYTEETGTFSYSYTLKEATVDEDGVIETDAFNVTVSDGAASASATITIEIVDDLPVAENDFAYVTAGQYGGTNLMLVVDLSGSMDTQVNYNGTTMTRLAATKLAVGDLLDSYDSTSTTMVRIVTFSSSAAAVGNTWMTVAQAQAYFDGLSDTAGNGSTNYDAALSVAQSAFNDAGKLDGAQNVSYFLSDGAPTTSVSNPSNNSGSTYNPELGDGIGEEGLVAGDQEVSRQEWEAFLNSNDIVSYAIGVGTGATDTTLEPIAWNGKTGEDLDAIVVTQESDLSDVLQATIIVNPVTGNVLDNDTSGADGWATPALVSVEYAGQTYTFDADNPSFTINLGANKGTLVIENDGDYTFTPPAGGSSGAPVEVIYTALDSDGDPASATLTIVNPMLVVGSNDDDSGVSTSAHFLPNPALVPDVDGDIVGSASADVLIGDLGGTTLVAGDTGNFVLVLDTSGSMSTGISFGGSTISRLEALQRATVDTLTKLANSGAENVRVHLVEFNTGAAPVGTNGTYDLVVNGTVNTAALNAAITAVNALDDGGYTNYEAGLQSALNWIGSNAPLANADSNKLLFISDGEPNRAVNNSGSVITVNAQDAVDHILGVDDSSNEVAAIENAGFTIEAIGINVNNTALGYLDRVEGAGGDADNITTAEQLSALVSDLAGATTTQKALGADHLIGGDGDDIIFGDTPNTDALSSDGPIYGEAGTHDGAGFAVLLDHLGSEQAVLNHLSDPDTAAQYNVSGDMRGEGDLIDGGSGNDTIFGQGGDDVIFGGAGDDTIYGGTGNDTLIAGAGLDQLIGNEGEDVFAFSALGGEGSNTISDFNLGQDVLRFHDVLDNDLDGSVTVSDLININLTLVDNDTIILDITGIDGREDTSITLHAAEGTDFGSVSSLTDLPVEVSPDTYSS